MNDPSLVMLVYQAVQASHADAVQIWPVTVAGWVTLVMAIFGLLGALYSYAKTMVHLNGLGERVTAVEIEQRKTEDREGQWIRSLDNVLAAQAGLLERIIRAEKSAESCSDDMQRYTIAIGTKIDDLRKVVNEEGRHAGERLASVEREILLTRRAVRGDG